MSAYKAWSSSVAWPASSVVALVAGAGLVGGMHQKNKSNFWNDLHGYGYMGCVVAWLIIAVWNYITAGYTSSNLWVAGIFFVVSVFGWFHANSMHTQEALHEQVGLLKKVNITLDETHTNLSDDAKNLEETMKEMDEQIEQYRGENVKNETMTIMEVFRHLSGNPHKDADKSGETLHVIHTYNYAQEYIDKDGKIFGRVKGDDEIAAEIEQEIKDQKDPWKEGMTVEANIETDENGGWKYTLKAFDEHKQVGDTCVTLEFERAQTADDANPDEGHVTKVIPKVKKDGVMTRLEGKIPAGHVKMHDVEDLFRNKIPMDGDGEKVEYLRQCFATEEDQIEFWRELNREVDIDLNEYVSQMQKMSSTM